VLDGAHSLVLRGIARGMLEESHAPAVRNLAAAGLIQPVDGAWALTQTGHAVLELEGGADQASPADLASKIRAWFMT
jgi:hypothetical protein